MRNAGLDEPQAGIKISRRNINNFRYADITTLMAEREELKNLLMKVKEESEKAGLKFNIHVLAIINSAAMNIGVHVSLSLLVSSVCMPSSGIAGS